MADKRPLELLMEAMNLAAVARGEAQWTNGYRAAYEAWASKNAHGTKAKAEIERLHEKEVHQWKHVEDCEFRFKRIAVSVMRTIAASNGARAKRRTKLSVLPQDSKETK